MKSNRCLLVAAMLVLSAGCGWAEETVPQSKLISTAESEDYCKAFADKAAEAKLARQKRELVDIKQKIEDQLLTLDKKTKELEGWVLKREQLQAMVSEKLTGMYANVEPDIAAQQLEKLDLELASEILQRLSPKNSGEIVSAMNVNFASRIVKSLAENSTSDRGAQN